MIKRSFLKCLFLLLSVSGWQRSVAQSKAASIPDSLFTQIDTSKLLPAVLGSNPRLVRMGDSLWIVSGICKPLLWRKFDEVKTKPLRSFPVVTEKKPATIKVHGNIQYDFIHRSYVDTPFAQRDFQQHTVQGSFTITVKDKYPLKLNISTRVSNSPYFSNFFDGGVLLDQFTFMKDAKKRLADKVVTQGFDDPDLSLLNKTLDEKRQRYSELKLRLSNPDILQRIIEEREKEYYRNKYQDTTLKLQMPDHELDLTELKRKITHKTAAPDKPREVRFGDDPDGDNYSDFIAKKKKELDSLETEISFLQKRADSITSSINKTAIAIKESIYKAKSRSELRRIELDNGIKPDKQDKFEGFLSNLRNIGIGRNMVNYTELTAQGIALTGLNMEYNDTRIYAAVVGGKIDYGFRNLLGKGGRQKGQHLMMARFGIGDKDRRALIFSMFTGRKFNYGSAFSDSVSDKVNLTGYSLEAIWAKDGNTAFSAEVAKSTKPISGRLRDNHEMSSLVDFSDKTNLGINIKGKTRIRETNTFLSGFYRRTGENFQSFNLFSYNTDQTAWHLKADQSLFKNMVDVSAMLRRNDFTNPFTDKTFKTSTVFISLQTTIRIPRWPVLSVGYFPGSQLYMIDRERVRENAYYILNGSLMYSYAAGSSRMTSSAIYNRYSSKGTDSGFISYKGVNYIASQAVMWRRMQLQAAYTFTDQEQLKYYTLEFNVEYNPVSFIRIGGGGKYNRLNTGKQYWGNRTQMGIDVKKMGTFQLLYEKSYLPTIYRDLFPVKMGRITWFKYF